MKSATKLKNAPKMLESYRDKNYNAIIKIKKNDLNTYFFYLLVIAITTFKGGNAYEIGTW